MGHSRIKMELIKKESTRMLTYHKRKKSLVKKVSEFSILCGVDACLIIFGPENKDQSVRKLDIIWPSNPDEAKIVISMFKKTDRTRRCYYVSDYFLERKKKVDAEISKLHKQIYEAKFPSWNVRLDNFSEDRLRVFLAHLESKLQVVDRKLASFQEDQNNRMDIFVPKMVNFINRTNNNNLQVFPDAIRPLDVQYPPLCYIPGQNSYTLASNSNFMIDSYLIGGNLTMDLNNDNNISSNSSNFQLQLFGPRPLDVELPMYFQATQGCQEMTWHQNLIQDVKMKTWNDQNFGNQFGGRNISNNPSLSGFSYTNPEILTLDNVIQHPVLSIPPNQGYPSETEKFRHGPGCHKQQDHNWN